MNKKGTYQSELRAEQAAATRARIVEAAAEGFAPWTVELPFNKGHRSCKQGRVEIRDDPRQLGRYSPFPWR